MSIMILAFPSWVCCAKELSAYYILLSSIRRFVQSLAPFPGPHMHGLLLVNGLSPLVDLVLVLLYLYRQKVIKTPNTVMLKREKDFAPVVPYPGNLIVPSLGAKQKRTTCQDTG